MSSVAYIMQWGDHKTNVHNHLRVLFEEQKFVDLTLFCSTHSVKVHSVVIASNSSYFEKVLLSQNGVNSVIVLKDMKYEVLRALIEFMYCGETTVLDEDVDALLYASKKFEVKGLSRMTRQGVVFTAMDKAENETPEPNHRFIFPAESAHPGMIQAVIDLTKKKDEAQIFEENKLDSLYFKKTAFQRRGRPHKKHESLGFSEAAMSDTEYAILKEAEESRKALEKLQRYVLNPNGIETGPQVLTSENSSFLKMQKNQSKSEESKSQDHSYSNLRHSIEDEIAAKNLTNELNQQANQHQTQKQQQQPQPPPPPQQSQHQHQHQPQLHHHQHHHHHHHHEQQLQQQQQQQQSKRSNQNSNNVLESTLLPTDVPIFVDDGNGNYVTLDVEMANMIAGQEIKYNLVQGVVMTSDGKGSQLSNPASILIPETQSQLQSMPILNCEEIEMPKLEMNSFFDPNSLGSEEKFLKPFSTEFEDRNSCPGKTIISKRKPFVVKEIIKLKQPKKNLLKLAEDQLKEGERVKEEEEEEEEEELMVEKGGIKEEEEEEEEEEEDGIRGILF